jgi:shikimate 5-dehydrogenase
MEFVKADKPTIYFIGVTTGKSSIMKVFPAWAKYLKLGDVAIKGFDLRLHDEPARYREVVDFIKRDPLSLGALVTTHKIDLLKACRDQFEQLDEYALLMGEISSISKRDGKLVGHAKDPITSGLALEAFLPADYWRRTGAETLVLGAGGSAIAITWHMMTRPETPTKIIVANRSAPRLHELREIHGKLRASVPVEYHEVPRPGLSDALCGRLKPGSLVINATGLGKDAPGSPLTDATVFPRDGLVWEFNYRGDLVFLEQARRQQQQQRLTIEDGWVYFLHGWTRVIAEVFHVDIPTSGPVFEEISRIAKEAK